MRQKVCRLPIFDHDNQRTVNGPHSWTRKVAAAVTGARLLSISVFALGVFASSMAAVRAADFSDRLMIEKGREVFLTAGGVGCSSCHGPYAEGNVGIGPYNRGSKERAIRTALQNKTSMEFVQVALSNTQIKQVAAYYKWLGQLKLVKTLAYRGRFVPDRVEVHPGTKVQLVVINANIRAHTFAADSLGFGKFTVEARDEIAVVWEAPENEGTFRVTCADCRVEEQALTIVVTNKAPKFVPGKPAPKPLARPAPAAPQKVYLTPMERKLASKGRNLFLNAGDVGCAGCHGRYAEGDVGIGSYNRGSSEVAIRRALKTVKPMAFLAEEIGEQEIKQIAAYYKSLAQKQLVKTMVVQGLVIPELVRVHPLTTVQLVVINNTHEPHTFISGPMGLRRFTVPAQEAVDLTWKAPNYRGNYALVCIDCPHRGQRVSIEVNPDVPPYTPPLVVFK